MNEGTLKYLVNCSPTLLN